MNIYLVFYTNPNDFLGEKRAKVIEADKASEVSDLFKDRKPNYKIDDVMCMDTYLIIVISGRVYFKSKYFNKIIAKLKALKKERKSVRLIEVYNHVVNEEVEEYIKQYHGDLPF